jgi:hypothetical protein
MTTDAAPARNGRPVTFQGAHRRSDGAFAGMDGSVRLWAKVDLRGAFECWPWLGTRTKQGYGQFQVGGRGSRQLRAHRAVYEALVGPIPEGLVLDHLCRNRACVNPAHLEPVTNAENLRRQVPPAPSPACPAGHLRTPENTYRFKDGNRCRPCHIAKVQRQYRAHTTTEAESGATTASRSSSDLVPPGPDRGSSEASTGHAGVSSSSDPVIAPASAGGGPFATHGATSPGHNPGPVSRPAPDLAGRQSPTSRGRGRSSDRAHQLPA